jgi:hypothetical protein
MLMVKIFEVQHQLNDVANYQSRVIEYDSFQEYLQNIEASLPLKENVEIGVKHVDLKSKTVTFMYEWNLYGQGAWIEFVHFAQVIEEE